MQQLQHPTIHPNPPVAQSMRHFYHKVQYRLSLRLCRYQLNTSLLPVQYRMSLHYQHLLCQLQRMDNLYKNNNIGLLNPSMKLILARKPGHVSKRLFMSKDMQHAIGIDEERVYGYFIENHKKYHLATIFTNLPTSVCCCEIP